MTSQDNNRRRPGQKPFSGSPEPHGVAELLGVVLDDRRGMEVDSDEIVAERLQAHLDRMWNPEDPREPLWARLVRPLLRGPGSDTQQTIGSLLVAPQTAVATIKAIRDHAKKRAASEDSEPEHAAMTTIYFGAIASALIFHRLKITTYSWDSLATSFDKLLRKAWMPASLIDLFQRAADVCRQK